MQNNEVVQGAPRRQVKSEQVSESVIIDGRYAVRREIASGGMGTIYEAENIALGELVAVKILNENVRDLPAIVERLRLEGRTLAAIRHPNIVSVRDMGTCPRLGPYLVLDLLVGRSLDGLLTTRPRLTVDEVVWLGHTLAQALSVVHAKRIVHRDLKPANIFIGREPGTNIERAQLLDFGIAFQETPDGLGRRLTHLGEIVGTPEYLPPEILLEHKSPTTGADIFSLAVVLYECLTGDVPFPGTLTAVSTGWVRDARPAPMNRADIPMALERVILNALSRDIALRPKTIMEFAEQLVRSIGYKPQSPNLLDGLTPKVEADGVSRRIHARAGYLAPMRITSSEGACDGRTEDISEGGALVIGGQRPPEDTEVSVRFPLPISGTVVSIQAKAKWCRTRRGTHAVGIEFLDLPETARSEIARYVAALSRPNPV